MPVAVQYEKDSNQNEVYPQNNNVDQVILNRYARDRDKIPFYPKDATKNEFMDPKLGLIKRNGRYVYPKSFPDGKPQYRDDPKDQRPRKKKIYEKKDGHCIIGRGLDGNEYYATDENGDEYYPENNMPAKTADGTVFYAHTALRSVIFPKNADDDEFYLTFIDPLKPHTNPGRYARKSNNTDEIYPQRLAEDNLISDYIINDTYAKRDGKNYYPKDGYLNEFYINPIIIPNACVPVAPVASATPPSDIILDTYAVTNDGKVILPGIGGKYYIDLGKMPLVKKEDILGKLIREGNAVSTDYLTKVEISNKPEIELMKYKYLDLNTNIIKTVKPPGISDPFFKTWYFWVLVVVSLIIKSYAIWWFFLKRKKFYQVK